MLAYKSSFLRRATIGDEYPTTLLDGELQRVVISPAFLEVVCYAPDRSKKGAIAFLL